MTPNMHLPQMTGLPSGTTGKKKRTRRRPGGGPMTHHGNLGRAIAANDHDTARKHAFALIRSLRAPTVAEGSADPADQAEQQVQPAMPSAPRTPNPNRLVSALRAMKKPAV